MNQDGQSNGLTVPNSASQEKLVASALSRAGVEPHEVDYIEAHGTGTSVGAPIEVNALSQVFADRPTDRDPLYIGSVKSNIGHLEQAAGVAGIIKIILAMQHELIPPNLHFQNANPLMDLESIPAKIPTESVLWPRSNRPRVAGISGFSFGGTNVHMVIQEPPIFEKTLTLPDKPFQLLTLSAKSQQALQRTVQAHKALFEETDASLADICHRPIQVERRCAIDLLHGQILLRRRNPF